MKTQVRKLWNGMLPVRSKFVDEALAKKQNLDVLCEGKWYTLTPELLSNPHTKIKVADYYKKDQYHWLCYYKVPKVEQPETKQLF